MKRVILKTKVINSLNKIKWHLLPKQVENRVDLYHDSDRDEESHIESKQILLTIMLELNDTYILTSRKQSRFISW